MFEMLQIDIKRQAERAVTELMKAELSQFLGRGRYEREDAEEGEGASRHRHLALTGLLGYRGARRNGGSVACAGSQPLRCEVPGDPHARGLNPEGIKLGNMDGLSGLEHVFADRLRDIYCAPDRRPHVRALPLLCRARHPIWVRAPFFWRPSSKPRGAREHPERRKIAVTNLSDHGGIAEEPPFARPYEHGIALHSCLR